VYTKDEEKKLHRSGKEEIVHAACDTVEPLQDLLELKAEKKWI
jgi:hypothetical protein